MMQRREFLKVACTAPLFPLLSPVSPEDAHTHPRLGRYVRHSLKREDIDWVSIGRNRYCASFPIEVILKVEFERGSARWRNFNCSQDLQDRMERMSPGELFRGATGTEPTLIFDDPVSIVDELYPERPRHGPYPHKKEKFHPAGETLSY